jgi:hypothetical protein
MDTPRECNIPLSQRALGDELQVVNLDGRPRKHSINGSSEFCEE